MMEYVEPNHEQYIRTVSGGMALPSPAMSVMTINYRGRINGRDHSFLSTRRNMKLLLADDSKISTSLNDLKKKYHTIYKFTIHSTKWFVSGKVQNRLNHSMNGNSLTSIVEAIEIIRTAPVQGPVNDQFVYMQPRFGFLTIGFCGWCIDVDTTSTRWSIITCGKCSMELIRQTMSRTQYFFRSPLSFMLTTQHYFFYFRYVNDDNYENWALSSRERNRRAHMLTGNTTKKPSKVYHKDEDLFEMRRNYVRMDHVDKKAFFIRGSEFKLTEDCVTLLLQYLKVLGCDMSSSRETFTSNLKKAFKEELLEHRKTGKKSTQLCYIKDFCLSFYYNNNKYMSFIHDSVDDEEEVESDEQSFINNINSGNKKDSEIKPVVPKLTVDTTDNSKDEIVVLPLTIENKQKFTFDPKKLDEFYDERNNPKTPPPTPQNQQILSPDIKTPNAPVNSGVSLISKLKDDMYNKVLNSKPVSSPIIIDYIERINKYSSRCNGSFLSNVPCVEKLPEPIQSTSFNDGSDIKILSYVDMKIVEIKNESIKSLVTIKTNDFLSNMTSKELYLEEIDREVRIPIDYLNYAVGFWTARSFTTEDLILFRVDTTKYAKGLALDHAHHQNLILYGPTIAMLYYYNVCVRVNPVLREVRHILKVGKIHKVISYVSKIVFAGIELFRTRRNMCTFRMDINYLKRLRPTYSVSGINIPYSMGRLCDPFKPVLELINPREIFNFGIQTPDYLTKIKNYISTKIFGWTCTFENFRLSRQSVITGWKAIPMNFYMFTKLPISFQTIKSIIIRNPIACILSPLIEEYDRTLFSTVCLSLFEWWCCGVPYTVPLHLLNYTLSKYNFSYNYQVRVTIHALFNILSINTKMYTASSLFTSGFTWIVQNLAARTRAGSCVHPEWDNCLKIPMITYPTVIENIMNKHDNKGVKDMLYSLKKKNTPYQYVVGPKRKDYLPIAFAQNKENEYAALKARVLKDTPKANGTTLKNFHNWLRENYKRIFPRTSRRHITPLSFTEYLEKSNAAPGVKLKLRRQYEKFVKEGINHDTKLTRQQWKKWTIRESFVKTENLNYRTPIGILDKAPRLIQGGKAEFICLVGPWIASLQNSVKEDWNSRNFICFTSGVKASDAAKLVTEFPVWMEDDVSAWDASCSKELLEIELWLYKKFGAPMATRQLMEANVNTVGITSSGLLYWRDGCRKSGDPYTSLGNSILNGLIHLYIFCRHHKIGIRECRKRLHMLVQGDDSLINVNRKDDIEWKSEMLKFGFKSIGTYKTNIDEVEFCSSRLYKNQYTTTFGPIPGKVIGKFGVYCSPPLDLNPYDVLYGSAVGLQYSSGSVPILNKFVEKNIEMSNRLRKENKYRDKQLLRVSTVLLALSGLTQPWKMNYTQQAIDSHTLSLLIERYSYSSLMGIKINKEIDNLSYTTYNESKFLNFVVDHDSSGPHLYCRGSDTSPVSLMF